MERRLLLRSIQGLRDYGQGNLNLLGALFSELFCDGALQFCILSCGPMWPSGVFHIAAAVRCYAPTFS